jgi:hypothetical protein
MLQSQQQRKWAFCVAKLQATAPVCLASDEAEKL